MSGEIFLRLPPTAVILLLWVHCLVLLPMYVGFCVWPLFCDVVLSACFSFTIILLRKI